MVYRYTSVKTVIAKVLADLDIQEENFRLADCLEWISEALEKIGSFPQFIIRTTGRDDLPLLELSNYQTELPFDFHTPIQLSYSSSTDGPFYPMRCATGSFEHNPVINDNSTLNSNIEDTLPTTSLVVLAMQLYDLSYAGALALVNTDLEKKTYLSSLLSTSSSTVSTTEATTDYIYVIRGGYIKTNTETGYIMLSYQAIPTDLEGYPLIPDTVSFREALYWYVNMKLTYPKWKSGQVRDAIYYDARRSWNYYCKQAFGDATMPDRGQLEAIKSSWLRLIPNVHEIDTDFSNLGERQAVYTHSTPDS